MSKYFKVVVYIPESHFRELQLEWQKVGAGKIGLYDCCFSYWQTMGTWRSLDDSTPFIGNPGEISEEPEIKCEVTITEDLIEPTLAAVRKVHPYEEPVAEVYPLYYTMREYIEKTEGK